jgi:hypothetical protein
MKIIPEELVEETWQEVAGFPPSRAVVEMERLNKKQPELLSFMMIFTQDMNRDVIELAIYMLVVVWRIFEKGSKKKLRKILSKEITKCHESNVDMMEKLEGAHEKFLERVAKVQLAAQPYVMKYVVDTLMEPPEDEEDVELTDEDTGYLFLLFKTVIDLLDQAG